MAAWSQVTVLRVGRRGADSGGSEKAKLGRLAGGLDVRGGTKVNNDPRVFGLCTWQK